MTTFPRLSVPSETAPLPEAVHPWPTEQEIQSRVNHAVGNARQTAMSVSYVLATHAEWIVVKIPGHPDIHTLRELMAMCSVDWSDVETAEMRNLADRLGSIVGKYVSGQVPVTLECFRCGLAKSACRCCRTHRTLELQPSTCQDCADDLGVEPFNGDGPDREVFDAR